jgi:tetratricopeptide (TPR) repeat protein
MPPPDVSIRVEEKWRTSRLIWPEQTMAPVELDPWWKWKLRNFDLYDSGVATQIDGIAGIGDVVQGMAILAKARAGGILPITGGMIADRMPWEALERRFIDGGLNYHPVRADGTVLSVSPDRAGPLRVALVVGHEGDENAFERDRQLALLKTAFSASAQVKSRIVDADAIATLDLVAVASAEDRRSFFKTADPHLVLYFGHGQVRPKPAVWVGRQQGAWLPLEELADYAVNDKLFPASWIFIACSIGEAPRRDTGPAGPEAFRILASRGARAMLAMRARIRPQLGQIVAKSLIESLSGGIPLELAAATARKTARRARESGTSTLVDWAAPAVWSTVVGPKPPRSADIPSQLIATKLTRAAADDPGVGLGPPEGDIAQTAARWSQGQRIRVNVPRADEPSLSALLAKITGSIAALSPRPTLFVRVKGSAPFDLRLAEWADSVLPVLDPLERETVIGRALQRLTNRDLDGLETLVGIPDIALIFGSPPGTADITAWTVLEGAGADATVVVGYISANQEPRLGWTLDRIDTESAMQNILNALGRYPRTLALAVVLDGPTKLDVLAEMTGEPSAEIAAAGLTIELPSGVVLAPSAREVVSANLQRSEIERAHRLVFEARRRIPPLIESDDNFAVVRDLVGARAIELVDFVNALAAHSAQDWSAAEWLRLARALEPAKAQWNALDPRILLEIAGALVARQTLQQARPWLDELETDDPALEAERLSLLSEIEKAEGTAQSQQRMWRYARDALERIERAAALSSSDARLRGRVRNMKSNIARLELYFNHSAEAAKAIFSDVLDELDQDDETAVAPSLTATLRNLAECLFEFEPFRSSKEHYADARRYLVRAVGLANRHGLKALGAEALYSTAKLDEIESDWPSARDHLTAATDLARSGGHAVCQRVAEMRLFWLAVRHEEARFDHAIFAVRLRKLEFLASHAWARRYAAQARLAAAHQLDDSGDRAGMRSLLERNIQSFEPWEQLTAESDKRMVALSLAGIASAEDGSKDNWIRFKTLAWSAAWIEDHGAADPVIYWRGDG